MGLESQISVCIVSVIIAFASNAALLLWDPWRRVLCTEGGSQVDEIEQNEQEQTRMG